MMRTCPLIPVASKKPTAAHSSRQQGAKNKVFNVAFIAESAEQATWSSAFAEAGLRCVAPEAPDVHIVFVDTRLPDFDRRLRELLAEHAEALPFILFLIEQDFPVASLRDLTRGGYDYAHLPIHSAVLAARAQRLWQKHQESDAMRRQLDESHAVAAHSMNLNARLGRLLQFMEHGFSCISFEQVVRAALKVLNEWQLHASVGVFHDRGIDFFSDDGQLRNIEQEIIESSRGLGRFYDFGSRTVINFAHVAILVRNMPIQQTEYYGTLKDHLYFLASALEARIAALILEKRAQERANRIQTTVIILQQIIADMENAKLAMTARSSAELDKILNDLSTEFPRLSLTINEEDRLSNMLNEAADRVNAIFQRSTQEDQGFRRLLTQLAETLKH